MLNRLKKAKLQKSDQGFTIVEVMIVLAIAGLILLIVLLAVPALQRNARNTQIKNDATTVAGGISSYESNNSGTVPTSVTGTGTVTLSSASGTNDTVKVGGSTIVTFTASNGSAPTPATSQPPLGTINVLLGHRCDGTVSARATAIYYSTETSGAQQQQCLDS